jgi:integrase
VTPKSQRSIREIDLSPHLRAELRKRYLKSNKTGLVFCDDNGEPLHPDNIIKRYFKPAVTTAKIKGNVRWHDLRHTFGALKIEQGANIYYIQRQMGHSSIQVTLDIYGHLLEERKPGEAAKTDALVFGH